FNSRRLHTCPVAKSETQSHHGLFAENAAPSPATEHTPTAVPVKNIFCTAQTAYCNAQRTVVSTAYARHIAPRMEIKIFSDYWKDQDDAVLPRPRNPLLLPRNRHPLGRAGQGSIYALRRRRPSDAGHGKQEHGSFYD